MTVSAFGILYLATAVPLLIADAIWLGIVARQFYRDALRDLIAPRVKLLPAALFYLGYPVGLVIFAVLPAASPSHAAVLGGLFGLFCYGTYDLVNYATLKGWPLRLTLLDIAWGTAASAFAATLASLVK